MKRRSFLTHATAATALLATPSILRAAYAPASPDWRRFEIVTQVNLPKGAPAQVWVPIPVHEDEAWIKPGVTVWSGNASQTDIVTDEVAGYGYVHAQFDGKAEATLEVTSQVTTRDRHTELNTPASLSAEDRARFTAPTALIPTNGIVLDTATEITSGATDDLDRARRIYDWVVEQTERNPETRGCGLGDVASMLHSGDLTGKCADLNALYVGLARAAGLPARDLYGLRVAPSAFGYKSLGAGSENVTGAQHCRAEVFIDGQGWMAVDPADVRKVVLQEAPDAGLSDPRVQDARAGLFGAAEGNWICYGTAHDIALPGSTGADVPFVMYPQAEVNGVRRDELDAANFVYTITARELDM